MFQYFAENTDEFLISVYDEELVQFLTFRQVFGQIHDAFEVLLDVGVEYEFQGSYTRKANSEILQVFPGCFAA